MAGRNELAGCTIAEIEARIQARSHMTASQVAFGVFIDTKLVGIAGLRREVLEQVRHRAASCRFTCASTPKTSAPAHFIVPWDSRHMGWSAGH
jgi:hypothetical protein